MISRVLAGVSALGLLAACAMPPQGVSAQDLLNYDEAVASIGCSLVGESDYLPVELQTGLTREQVIAISQYKIAIEQAVALENGGVKLVTGVCA
jgi:alkylhydroperoxidase family enzyme